MIEIGKKTLIMGILNITPDSFSDGGFFYSAENAISHAKKMVEDGADIIDIGAESTRPNFTPISADEEISRLEKILPAIKNLGVPISIDTYKPEVAEFAINNGAAIINDISGKMFDVAKKFNVPIIAMHNRKVDGDIISDIKKFFTENLRDDLQIIFDVGIGFNKTQEENLTILKSLNEFRNFPTLLGVSRKSVIGYATGFDVGNRDEATGAICVWAASCGVNIVRVHNVAIISKMLKMADILIHRGD